MGKYFTNYPRRDARLWVFGAWGLSVVILVLWMLFTVLAGFFIVGLQVLCIAELVVMVPSEVGGLERIGAGRNTDDGRAASGV